MKKTIMYQGIPGSFSHSVAEKYFGRDHKLVGYAIKFRDIFKEFMKSSAGYLVIPIENTLAGSIYENYDNLYNFNVHVAAEVNLKIEHHLQAVQGTELKNIKKVFSHTKALEQCEVFFEKNPDIEEVAMHDTAAAAKFVADKNDKSLAAIASKSAAKRYGLTILKRNIEDDHRNWTRFFIVGRNEKHNHRANKASIIFLVAHRPGSLFHALKSFADHRLNMTKLESRPLPENPFEYFFYVDFEFDNKHFKMVKETLGELKQNVHFLKVLGFYTTSFRNTK